ncbi:MAG TPA: hypothetical protein PK724_08925, partial [Pseudomonadales bacterium]|nr:hypothetical protein [Pseudomonadales bacterium]
DDAPYLLEYYYDDLQAYRSDRIAGLQAQPDPDGVVVFQYGTYTYRNVMTKADFEVAGRVDNLVVELEQEARKLVEVLHSERDLG